MLWADLPEVPASGGLQTGAPPLARRRVLALMLGLGPAAAGAAPDEPRSTGPNLTVRHPSPAGASVVKHDARSLGALGTVQVTTSVPWNPEPHVWEGVPLRRLLNSVSGQGRPIRLKALNDYEARIPWQDLERYDPILAWHLDGQPIPVRAKGPLIVIYPFSAHPELRRAEYIDRSVWHVSEITVE